MTNRSLRETLTRRSTLSIDKLPFKIVPSSKPNGLNKSRISTLRNISHASIRVKKSKSLLDVSKENEPSHSNNSKPLAVPSALSLKSQDLGRSPHIVPSFTNKFQQDFTRLESKLTDFYSSNNF